MNTDKFITNKLALTTLRAACLVVLISLSVRQVFGMFFMDFNIDLGISNTEFGLAIGIQMLGWGLSGPIFGAIADKYGLCPPYLSAIAPKIGPESPHPSI